MCVWSVSRKIRATVSCNGHFMIIMVRTAGNVEGMALAQAASHWRKTNPFRHWTCVCSCEHDKNLCTSFVCEVSAKKYAQLYHVRARGLPFVNHRLHHCWKVFLCARGSKRQVHMPNSVLLGAFFVWSKTGVVVNWLTQKSHGIEHGYHMVRTHAWIRTHVVRT